jgi:hypothetical protein
MTASDLTWFGLLLSGHFHPEIIPSIIDERGEGVASGK